MIVADAVYSVTDGQQFAAMDDAQVADLSVTAAPSSYKSGDAKVGIGVVMIGLVRLIWPECLLGQSCSLQHSMGVHLAMPIPKGVQLL